MYKRQIEDRTRVVNVRMFSIKDRIAEYEHEWKTMNCFRKLVCEYRATEVVAEQMWVT